MKVTFAIEVEIDGAALELEAKRAGLSLERAQQSLLNDIECRLHDSIQYRNAVEKVAVKSHLMPTHTLPAQEVVQ